jgi:hypothetical protein
MNAIQLNHAQPVNASEVAYLANATPSAPTLEQRAERLAGLHALGQALPDNTASSEARAAWAKRGELAAPAAASSVPAAVARRPAPMVSVAATVAPVAAQTVNPAPARSYSQRLRDSLAGRKLTPGARAAIETELAGLKKG